MHLPIHDIREDIVAALRGSGRAVITAPTGSGKSTQVPCFVRDLGLDGTVAVLEPRRLAARMLAQRVAAEEGTALGDGIGFVTRFKRAVSGASRIVFMTEGVFLRRLLAGDDLAGISAVVFDEFHERSVTADLCLGGVRSLAARVRPDLLIAVMSATLDAAGVCDWFGGCPHLHAEGRMFPVETFYLPRRQRRDVSDLVADAVAEIVAEEGPGDILAFLPGSYEIRQAAEACRRVRTGGSLAILPLYGDLPPERQAAVFEPAAGRKLILATNIAETSLTIPGVRHVIDSGLVRQHRHDPVRRVNMLETVPVCRDSADQRTGRAGREGPGTCRRLWTQLEQNAKEAVTLPEIRRVDLTEAVATVKALGFHRPREFPWFESPDDATLDIACRTLDMLGFTDRRTGALNRRGRIAAGLPVHPRLGLLMMRGAELGCLDDCVLAAAILSERPVLLGGSQTPESRRRLEEAEGDREDPSDLYAVAELIRRAERAGFAPEACRRLGVHGATARRVAAAARQLRQAAAAAFRGVSGTTAGTLPRAMLAAYPDRLARRRDRGTLLCEFADGHTGELARESTVRGENLLVPADVREVKTAAGRMKTILSLVSAVREDWLLEDFPDDWTDADELVWDESAGRVLRHRRLACLGVAVEESIETDVPPDRSAEALAERVESGKLTLKHWDDRVESWIARVRWVADRFPERGLPAYAAEDLRTVYRIICTGARTRREVVDRPCLDAVRHFLSWDDITFVERMAPDVIPLPSGRRLRMSYTPGQVPKGAATVQDLYDLTETPAVAGGAVRVLLDIRAPNRRTVQITDDLARFWRETYPSVKREFARRYTKHEWR